MPNFITYDATGKITRKGYCQASDLQIQPQAGESVLDVTDNTVYDGTFTGCYVDASGAVHVRTPVAYTCPATASVGTAVTLTAPTGAAVTIDGNSVGVVDATGSDSITFSDAGTYTVDLSLWPFLDVSFEVTAS
jgi:hypothetical protein